MKTKIVSNYAISKECLDEGLKVAEIALYAPNSEAYEESLVAHDKSSWDAVEDSYGPIEELYDTNPWITFAMEVMEGDSGESDLLMGAAAASLAGASDKDVLHMAALMVESKICRAIYFETVSQGNRGSISIKKLSGIIQKKFYKGADLEEVQNLVAHLVNVMEELGFLQCRAKGKVEANYRHIDCPVSAAVLVKALDFAVKDYSNPDMLNVKLGFPIKVNSMSALHHYTKKGLWNCIQIREGGDVGGCIE